MEDKLIFNCSYCVAVAALYCNVSLVLICSVCWHFSSLIRSVLCCYWQTEFWVSNVLTMLFKTTHPQCLFVITLANMNQFFSLLHFTMNCRRNCYIIRHLSSDLLPRYLPKFEPTFNCTTLCDSVTNRLFTGNVYKRFIAVTPCAESDPEGL